MSPAIMLRLHNAATEVNAELAQPRASFWQYLKSHLIAMCGGFSA